MSFSDRIICSYNQDENKNQLNSKICKELSSLDKNKKSISSSEVSCCCGNQIEIQSKMEKKWQGRQEQNKDLFKESSFAEKPAATTRRSKTSEELVIYRLYGANVLKKGKYSSHPSNANHLKRLKRNPKSSGSFHNSLEQISDETGFFINRSSEKDAPNCEFSRNNPSSAVYNAKNKIMQLNSEIPEKLLHTVSRMPEQTKVADQHNDNISKNSPNIEPNLNSTEKPICVNEQSFENDNYRTKQLENKRLSKLIEIDGASYIMTMEPSAGCASRSYSMPFLEIPAHLAGNRGMNGSSYPHLKNGFDYGDPRVMPRSASKEIQSWYLQRDAKSAGVNIEQCGASNFTEPYKIEALDHAALRLRKILQSIKEGLELPSEKISSESLTKNLQYSIDVLESNYLKMSRFDADDQVLENLSRQTPVPEEIKSWLVETFSNKKLGNEKTRQKKDRRTLRSVVRTVQAGMMFDRIMKKPIVDPTNDYIRPEVLPLLKNIDKWNFDVFELEKTSNNNALVCVCYQLLTKYDLLKRYKISTQALFSFCDKLQKGYRKHSNRYHNPVHAADVAQTLNCLISQSGFVNWFSDLEIFSMIMAAIIHDVEHTGTTNNFHINTKSNLALLYNDRSVLEQHHVSTAFRIMQEENCDILSNFSRDDYQDCRSLIVEMVLATDMNQHFEQIKHMEDFLQRPDMLEKSKAMNLILHSSDINHPSKPWNLHYSWTKKLVFEFFDQGDRERKRDLPISPLCDRHSAKIAQSQIGFIDFVIFPTFSTLLHLFSQVSAPSIASLNAAKVNANFPGEHTPVSGDILKSRFGDVELNSLEEEHEHSIEKLDKFRETLFACVNYNKSQWVRKDQIESDGKLFGDKAFDQVFIPDPLPSVLTHCFENGDGAKYENGNSSNTN